jgi:hypothetical protein
MMVSPCFSQIAPAAWNFGSFWQAEAMPGPNSVAHWPP